MITTDRLTIRPLDEALIEEMKEDYPIHQRFLKHVKKLSIDPTLKGWDAWIVQKKDGTYIGDIGFKGKPNNSQTIEIGYGFTEDHRGYGYATESVKALIDYTLVQHPGLHIKATSLKENIASNNVLKKLGFEIQDEDTSFYYWMK